MVSQKELISPGSIQLLDDLVEKSGTKNVFLVRGNNSYFKSGADKALLPIIQKCKVVEFSGFSVNPKLEEAQTGLELFKGSKAELIIAVGGGSVIDMAKIIKYLILNDPANSNMQIPQLIAIPTTAGTGSEATHFAVVYIEGIKHSYAHESILPNVALVDANLLHGQSNYQMAVSGIDAFAQGIESYWSIHSTEESMQYAEKAIKLIWNNLEKAIHGDKPARQNIAQGSFMAGKAINITKTTAPHALSYGFTTTFGLPHGHAVALFLPFFSYYHGNLNINDCFDPRGANFVKKQVSNIKQYLDIEDTAIEISIARFLKSIKLEIRFKKLGLTSVDFESVSGLVNIERLQNNPGLVTKELIKSIYYFNNKFDTTN